MRKMLFLFTFLSAGFAFAADIIGVVTYVFGDVKINEKNAQENDRVRVNDVAVTGDNSRLQVILIDDNVVNLNSNTKMGFMEYEFDADAGKKWSLFYLNYGSVRSLVNQKYKKEDLQGFQISTPSGVIGVRGTDFLVEHQEKEMRTEVTTFGGEVSLGQRGTGRKIRDAIKVPPGHFMQLLGGRRAFARAQRQEAKRFEFLRDTTDHPVQVKNRVFQQLRQERARARQNTLQQGIQNRRKSR